MADRVRPLKMESPASGGTELDQFPTGTDPNEDHVEARGVFLQNDTSEDEQVHLTRDSADRLNLKDGENPSGVTLGALVSPTGVFGTQYQADDYTPLQETSDDEWTHYHRWTTTDLPAGDYFVSLIAQLHVSRSGVTVQGRIQLDDATDLVVTAIKPGADGGSSTVSFQGNLALSGVHNFDFDFLKEAGVGLAGMREAHGVLFRAA